VHGIKLDRCFARVGDARTRVLVRHTVALAHELGLQVIAEGIEDAATRDALAELGCDLGQGLHFGPAVPAADWAALIAELPG
jgi:diguanylate cyclase